MPSVRKIVDIKADPEKVFDLIANVENFSQYSSLVKKITAIGPLAYHWVVNIYGIELEWDAKVFEFIKPKKFAWQSVRGVHNSGFYVLEPIKDGTRVVFFMEYLLPNAVLERLAQVLASGFMETMADELLENVKKALEKS